MKASDIRVTEGKDIFLLDIGNFLDEYYCAPADKKEAMINAAPAVSGIEDNTWFAYTASAVHKLANDDTIAVPDWVWDKKSYLADPYFGGNAKGRLRLYFMYTSPPEFKHRNMFVDSNALKRV
jgi:hypothetical protein